MEAWDDSQSENFGKLGAIGLETGARKERILGLGTCANNKKGTRLLGSFKSPSPDWGAGWGFYLGNLVRLGIGGCGPCR